MASPFGESPDPLPDDQPEGQERPFFDFKHVSASAIQAIPLDHSALRQAMDPMKYKEPQRAANVFRYAVYQYQAVTGASDEFFPTEEIVAATYYREAVAISERIRHTEIEAAIEILDMDIEPIKGLTPVILAERIARMESFSEPPKLALIMMKLWLIDQLGVEISTPLALLRAEAITSEVPPKRTRF